KKRGKITAALRMRAFLLSRTDLHASTRCTMSCSAPCEDKTITVPPIIPIQRLKGGPRRNFRNEVPEGAEVFNQCSFPPRKACEKTAAVPPSTSVGIKARAKRPPRRNSANCAASVQMTALTPPTQV